ncbi:hypothetical protein [Streptomyces sp. NBC_00503]|uniref:hypothetical protein n=1 Tax=Streptomyces sp. NBC_00503 TaxID=2903659 RepID=UPI002E80E90F|nr:hypothetical protein [Streptomyces sp. NBC_00503]WUD79393.1 hypothetical protein OG490_01725 [Streptomyces sp. NBC_00503]
MLTQTVYEDSRLSFWLRVREFAVPPAMIGAATARRLAGDWAGACAAAAVDIDFNLRFVARAHGRELAARLRADLRHLAPDLLRWHMPRIAPDGLLRPGLTITLARYEGTRREGEPPVHLVARTPPAWADAGQRISLALWDGSRSLHETGAGHHPHARPDRRFRLDLHRHLWDARRTDELRIRSGAGPDPDPRPDPDPEGLVPPELHCAVGRWAAEAGIVLRAEGRTGGHTRRRPEGPPDGRPDGRPDGIVTVRVGTRHRLDLHLVPAGDGSGPPELRITAAAPDARAAPLPVLPDAATWVPPDLELLRNGLIHAERLHPLVARALVSDHAPAGPAPAGDRAGVPHLVECRGAVHRIGLADGVLVPLDHDPAEIRREELLVALTGTPLPCLQAIDAAHRRPDCLTGVRERLAHGDTAGALAVVEGLLGPEAVLRTGALLDELAAAAQRRIAYGLFRAGLAGRGPDRLPPRSPRPRGLRSHPRHTTAR